MIRLLAIDPGKMTGVCVVEFDGSEVKVIHTDEVKMEDRFTFINGALSRDEYGKIDKVVIEDFKITPGTGKLGSPDWSLRIIGAVELMCDLRGIPLTKQFPSNAKAFSTNEKLRAVGMWHKGGAGHANDSLRHAMLYMVKHGWRDDRLLEADSE